MGNEYICDYFKLKAGKWIVVINQEVFSGDTAKEAYENARQKYPKEEPFIAKIPENKVMLL